MKKYIILILLIPLISGCNYKELNNLSIINSMAIDYSNNKYKVTVQVLNTDKNNNEQDNTFNGTTYMATGKNISDAINNINLTIPKKIYLGHLELLVLSKQLVNNKLNNIISYFVDNNEVNKDFTVLLSLEDSANTILSTKELLSSYPYGNILGSIENSTLFSGISSNTKFIDLANSLSSDYNTPILSTVKIKNKTLTISNLAILKNNKIFIYLDNKYNLAYNFITNNINDAIINYKCNNKYSSVKISNSNTIIKPKIKNNMPYINIYITGDIYVIENNCNDNKNTILNNTNKEVKNIINNILIYSKNKNIDIFNIEELYYKFKNNYYNSINFKKIYNKLNYNIITKLEVR